MTFFCMSQVLKSFEDDIAAGRTSLLPKGDAAEMCQWISRWSKTVKLNLCPLFEFWQWSFASNCCETTYKPFLPSDDVTSNG